MIPASVDLEWVRGDDYEKFGLVQTMVWDEFTSQYIAGPYRDLTGWVGLAQFRATEDSPTVLFTASIVLGNQTTSRGSFWIRVAAVDTEDTSTLTGKWDLQWTTDLGKIKTYAAGDWKLRKDTSRAE